MTFALEKLAGTSKIVRLLVEELVLGFGSLKVVLHGGGVGGGVGGGAGGGGSA